MEKQKRLQDLERLLRDNMDKEYNFDEIYQKLLFERHIEDDFSSDKKNFYLKDLNKTINDEAAKYKEKKEKKRKNPNSNLQDEYCSFIKAFKQDVNNELGRLTNSSNNKL